MGLTATRLVVARADLLSGLAQLLRRERSSGAPNWLTGPLAQGRTPNGIDLLAGPLAAGPGVGYGQGLLAGLGRTPLRVLPRVAGEGAWAVLCLGEGAEAGSYYAAWQRAGHCPLEPIDEVALAGPGFPCTGQRRSSGGPGERWSRTAGALGDKAWLRLRSLSVAVVGCGRTGSQLAMGLARSGWGRLVLVDPDLVEEANLDASATMGQAELGWPKVEAVARAVAGLGAGTEVVTLQCPVGDLEALWHVRGADLVACCADDDGARWATAVLASLYLRPVLDIGTGVSVEGGQWRAGADVRLVYPGEGCLVCAGGLSRPERAASYRRGAAEHGGWHHQRAGSLASLNLKAVGLGLGMAEGAASGKLGSSAWQHLEVGRSGLATLEQRRLSPARDCPLCRLRGRGDSALGQVPSLPGEATAHMLSGQ